MRVGERNKILQKVAYMNDEQLEKEYYDSVYRTLGSEAEIMEERGYEEIDIKERRAYEKYQDEYSTLLGHICEIRGIKLWEDKNNARYNNSNNDSN